MTSGEVQTRAIDYASEDVTKTGDVLVSSRLWWMGFALIAVLLFDVSLVSDGEILLFLVGRRSLLPLLSDNFRLHTVLIWLAFVCAIAGWILFPRKGGRSIFSASAWTLVVTLRFISELVAPAHSFDLGTIAYEQPRTLVALGLAACAMRPSVVQRRSLVLFAAIILGTTMALLLATSIEDAVRSTGTWRSSVDVIVARLRQIIALPGGPWTSLPISVALLVCWATLRLRKPAEALFLQTSLAGWIATVFAWLLVIAIVIALFRLVEPFVSTQPIEMALALSLFLSTLAAFIVPVVPILLPIRDAASTTPAESS
ncbi:MAG: hypothetical protein AAGK78_04890 [Planctomycetota bacterium]